MLFPKVLQMCSLNCCLMTLGAFIKSFSSNKQCPNFSTHAFNLLRFLFLNHHDDNFTRFFITLTLRFYGNTYVCYMVLEIILQTDLCDSFFYVSAMLHIMQFKKIRFENIIFIYEVHTIRQLCILMSLRRYNLSQTYKELDLKGEPYQSSSKLLLL